MRIIRDPERVEAYLKDASNLKNGMAEGVFIPESEAEIVEILKKSSKEGTPTTIAGGLTGNVGGSIPAGGWVLSLEKFCSIIVIDHEKKTALLQPGVHLKTLDQKAKHLGLFYPPDPTEQTATIGGTVATNASGSRSLIYGSTRDWINRIRVILASGDILDIKRGQCLAIGKTFDLSHYVLRITHLDIPNYTIPNVKSSAGYYSKPNMDLIDLFIGSEGTLGVITEIEVKLLDLPLDIFDIVIFFKAEDAAVQFSAKLKSYKEPRIYSQVPSPLKQGSALLEEPETNLPSRSASAKQGVSVPNDILSIEYFDENSLKLLKPYYPNIPNYAKAAIYLEAEITKETESSYLEDWGKIIEESGARLDDSWLGMNDQQKKHLKEFRHAMPEHINEEFKKHNTQKFASDIAVPDKNFREMLDFYNQEIEANKDKFLAVKFGHLGQSHLHVNLVPLSQEYIPLAKEIIMKFIKKGIALGGTCSAEHGIGKLRREYLKEMYGEEGINEMRRIKQYFDPAGILNRGDIFPLIP